MGRCWRFEDLGEGARSIFRTMGNKWTRKMWIVGLKVRLLSLVVGVSLAEFKQIEQMLSRQI